ncbi:oligosaccharide flippase family protein [Gemmiger sp.]
MERRRKYLQNAALLTGSGLVLRLLGMGFRVVLAAYLGSEGMGLYQLILAVYMVFVSLATAGINVASARLAAQSLARGSGMAETLRGLCFTALAFGTAAMLLQAALAEPCARYLLHDLRAETALRILAPSLPFMAVSGAVRGCFLAARRVQPNITAQLIEQLVRMAVAVAGLRALAHWGAGYGCAAVLLGNTVSEGVSCGIMLAFAARTPEFAPRPGAPLHPYTRRELCDILWPVEGSRLLASALQAAESSLIPYTLTLYTGSRAAAVAQYGSLKGMALPLLFFPFSVLGALSGLLMPEITRAHTKGDLPAMRRLIFTMLRVTCAFSLAAGAGFVVFGAPLAELLYRDAAVGEYVRVLGFIAPFMYLESMVDGVLKGLGEQLATFRYSLIDSVFRITAIWILLPRYGMAGFLAVMAASNMMTCGLNLQRMVRQIKKPSPEEKG